MDGSLLAGDSDAVVIGAGAAGLAAAVALRRAGLTTVVLDRGATVGESWRRRYDRLRLNTARSRSGLPFTPIPAREGSWVTREGFAAYLASYAAAHRIVPHFGVTVRRIERSGERWQLVVAGERTLMARVVVVATGHEHSPHLPNWPGAANFTGRLLHSSAYKNAREFAGADVLVAGTGSSGLEIAADLVPVTRRVRVAMRETPNLFPRSFMGVPMLPTGLSLLLRLPTRPADRAGALLQRLVWGDLRAYGFPRARRGFASNLRGRGKGPVFDDWFVPALRSGACSIVAAVEAFEGARVRLADGSTPAPDVVIAATGYRRGLEPLVGHLGVLDAAGSPICNAREDLSNSGLFFIGYALPPLVHLTEGAARIAASARGLQARTLAVAREGAAT